MTVQQIESASLPVAPAAPGGPPPDGEGALRRALVVNADDFGRTPGVNAGVARAHAEGVVTSASLMVRWPASDEAAAYARRSGLAVGLHLDLGEWVQTGGEWAPAYEVVPTGDPESVRAEIANQLGRFHKLLGRPPSHIDSHQHVHRSEPVRSAVADFARRLRVPVRELTTGVRYCGGFYGQLADGSPYREGITVENLLRLLDVVEPGVTELSCHPGAAEDGSSSYGAERCRELEVLCHPDVRAALTRRGIELVSFDALTPVGVDAFALRPDGEEDHR